MPSHEHWSGLEWVVELIQQVTATNSKLTYVSIQTQVTPAGTQETKAERVTTSEPPTTPDA